jgi:hypothetical protein
VVFLVVSQIVTIGAVVVLGSMYGNSGLIDFALTLPLLQALVSWSARVFVRQKSAYEDDVVVRCGHPIGANAKATYYVGVAVASSSLLTIAALCLLAPQQVSTPVGFAKFLLSGFEGFLVLITIRSSLTAYHEIVKSRTQYRSPTFYDPLKFSAKGEVFLGPEFRHETVLPITASRKEADGVLPGEVVGRHISRMVGQDGPFAIDLASQRNPHVVIFGSSGTGKSQTAKAVELRYWETQRIPFLVIDWQGEQANFVAEIGGVVRKVPRGFKLNPLRLGVSTPSQRVAEIEESLIISLDLSPLQAFEVGKIVTETYRARGIREEEEETWTLSPPSWNDIIQIMDTKLRSGQYSGEQIESVNWTIRKLLRASHVFGEEPQEFLDIVLKVPTCIDLSELMGVDLAKSLVTYTILQRIYNQFAIRGFSDLKLLVVLDEAHQVFGAQVGKVGTQESLPLKIIRLGRKYGFGVVIVSQLATDIPESALSNAATVIAMMHDEPQQVNYVRKFLNLTKSEREIYASLPRGGAFIKHLGEPHPHLVQVQMVSGDEIQAIKALTERLRNEALDHPAPSPSTGITRPTAKVPSSMSSNPEDNRTSPLGAKTLEGTREAKEIWNRIKPNDAVPAEFVEDEVTSLGNAVLRHLETKLATVRELLTAFPNIEYRQMLVVLTDLHKSGLIQEVKVANLNGKGTVFYAALRAEWLQSESIEHRAMVTMIAEALTHLHPVLYMQTKADAPDIGLELANPKAAVEVETGRKKLTPDELDRWAKVVRERDRKLGYHDALVVVPNAGVEKRYRGVCEKYGLELATMKTLGENLYSAI